MSSAGCVEAGGAGRSTSSARRTLAAPDFGARATSVFVRAAHPVNRRRLARMAAQIRNFMVTLFKGLIGQDPKTRAGRPFASEPRGALRCASRRNGQGSGGVVILRWTLFRVGLLLLLDLVQVRQRPFELT